MPQHEEQHNQRQDSEDNPFEDAHQLIQREVRSVRLLFGILELLAILLFAAILLILLIFLILAAAALPILLITLLVLAILTAGPVFLAVLLGLVLAGLTVLAILGRSVFLPWLALVGIAFPLTRFALLDVLPRGIAFLAASSL